MVSWGLVVNAFACGFTCGLVVCGWAGSIFMLGALACLALGVWAQIAQHQERR